MDFVTVRIVWTVLTFAVFVAILVWAYSGQAREGFEAAARLPLEEDGPSAANRRSSGGDAA
jgi:cytochrome c oxidase cbb3-type subunit 4